MKYILKIFLIVLLVVAIIGAACWFFLVQRPDLTMSVFAHWGDYFYDAGRYNRAVSLYETACKLSPENANLPVRLAQAYINSGNYTKAEYTLVSAITNNPESVQLYVALSKTYIEQDKILDAEQMLELLRQQDAANMMKYCVFVAATVPMLIIYPFLQKDFAKGVMIGSVKG